MNLQGAGRGIVFQMPRIPGLLFPPPPPPPPILSYSSSYASPAPHHHHASITSFPILVVTVLGILATSVLLLTYYVFVIRCCLHWHDSNVAALIRRRRTGTGTVASSSSSTLPVTGAPAEARGLQESTIQTLPTFRYRKKAIKSAAAAGSAPTSECAVCLSEFEEEERVRMLPTCLHAFHVDCIDTWLQGNANCPLCRADITGHCVVPLDQLLRPRPEEVVVQVATRTDLAEDTRAQQQQASTAAAEPAGDTATTAQQVSSRDSRNNAWRDVEISSKDDEWDAVKKDRDVLPLRRSSSVGSLGAEEVRLQIQNIFQRNTRFHRDDDTTSSTSSSVV